MNYNLPVRPRRLRRNEATRALLRENRLDINDFIMPLFVDARLNEPREIASMPGQFQLPLSALAKEAETIAKLGIRAVLLFGLPHYKDSTGSAALCDDGIIQQAIKIIRQAAPELLIITDLCFCEYTDHGHCGLIENQELANDNSLPLLAAQALSHAQAGADWIAPSGMLDGMVLAIRQALDEAGFTDRAILSYSVKYCSSFYGPFREAAQGTPQFGDRKTYQMDPGNSREALREVELDLEEGADMIMVKPAMNYLDVIYRLKQTFPAIPLCAYQVSGEYAMIKFAAKNGLVNEEAAMLESLTAIQRAGADMIISYFAKDVAKLLSFGAYG